MSFITRIYRNHGGNKCILQNEHLISLFQILSHKLYSLLNHCNVTFWTIWMNACEKSSRKHQVKIIIRLAPYELNSWLHLQFGTKKSWVKLDFLWLCGFTSTVRIKRPLRSCLDLAFLSFQACSPHNSNSKRRQTSRQKIQTSGSLIWHLNLWVFISQIVISYKLFFWTEIHPVIKFLWISMI